MMPKDLAALDLNVGSKKPLNLSTQGRDGESRAFEDLLKGSSLEGSGISKEKLVKLVEGAKDGKQLPLSGKDGQGSQGSQGSLADLLDEVGGIEGMENGRIALFLGGDGKLGADSGMGQISGIDQGLIVEGQVEGRGESSDLAVALVLLGDDAKGQSWGIKLSGEGEGEDWQSIQAGREELLQALTELKRQGLQGEELMAAMEQRVAALKDEGKLGSIEVELVSGADQLEENLGLDMENLGAGGGFGPLLNGFGLGGESADMPRERGGGLFQNTLGEQIFRELRAGGVLTATGGFAAGDFAGQGAADSGNSSFGGERQAGADTLMQSLNGVEQRRGEETSLGRAEFGSLLAAAQGGSTPALEGLARGSTPQYSVQHQVGQDGFTPAVGERIDWMLKGGVKEARLQLNPPGMGPLDVMVTVGEERTTVNMVAHNTATREALQEDLQRLRNMLADQGNGEVEVNVSSGGEDDKQDGAVGLAGQETAGGGGQGDSPDGEGDELLERGADNPVKGLIDHFA